MSLDPDDIDMTLQIDAYLDGVIDPSAAERLKAWIVEEPEHAQRFLLRAEMHHHLRQVYSQNRVSHLAEGLVQDTDSLSLLEQLAQMEDSVVIASPVDITERIEKQQLSYAKRWREDSAQKALSKRPRVIVVPEAVVWAGLAAAVVIVALIMLPVFQSNITTPSNEIVTNEPALQAEPESPQAVQVEPIELPQFAAMIEDLDARWVSGGEQAIGQPMRQGEYYLESGRATLRFENGAIVVLESPLHFELNAGDAMTLHRGNVVAYCNLEARGFKVRTPHALFTDLGTEFGVSVSPTDGSQLHVFDGEVQAELSSSDEGAEDPYESLRVVANQAIIAAPSDRAEPLRRMKVDPNLFLTTRRQVVASLNTGADVDGDGQDRQWMVTRINDQPITPAAPAVLFIPPTKAELGRGPVSKLPEPIFLPNQQGRLCWIKPDPELVTDQRINTTTYRATFDLAGYQLDTTQLDLRYNADNSVLAIRLNSRALDRPEFENEPPYVDLTQITASEGFVSGENQLEIVVINDWPTSSPESQPGINYTGLIAKLSVTAQPTWIPAEQQGAPLPN
ncbi:MAG: FecR domain-containing protein [Planctomycetota bacterium]